MWRNFRNFSQHRINNMRIRKRICIDSPGYTQTRITDFFRDRRPFNDTTNRISKLDNNCKQNFVAKEKNSQQYQPYVILSSDAERNSNITNERETPCKRTRGYSSSQDTSIKLKGRLNSASTSRLNTKYSDSRNSSRQGSKPIVRGKSLARRRTRSSPEQLWREVELLKNLFEDSLMNADKKKLLLETDVGIIEEFLKMNRYHQYFLVQLFLCEPSWYSMGKFCSEIKLDQKLTSKELNIMLEYHSKNKYIHVGREGLSNLNTDELLDMLQLDDLKKIAVDLKLKKKNSIGKNKLIEFLQGNTLTQCTLTMEKSSGDILKDLALRHLGHHIKMKEDTRSSFHKVYVLGTYINSSYCTDVQNYLKDIVYLEVTYPGYDVENVTLFKNKEQFSSFYQAVLMKQELLGNKDMDAVKNLCYQVFQKLKFIDKNAGCHKNLPKFLHQYSAEYCYISILISGIKKLTKNYDDVEMWLEFLIEKYPLHEEIGYFYKRLVQVTLKKSNSYQAAARIVIEAFEIGSIFDIDQLFELKKLAHHIKMKNSYKVCPIYFNKLVGFSEPPSLRGPLRVITADKEEISKTWTAEYGFMNMDIKAKKENLATSALEYYSKHHEYKGVHCYEGELMVLLFNLAFWDIIYEHYVPMAFLSEFQYVPLDMYSDSFYKHRQREIESRLKQIANGWPAEKLERVLRENWNNHRHQKSFFDFDKLEKDIDEVLEMFRCIDRRVLSKILGRLALNERRFRKGFPHLFLWKTTTSKCKFVTIKGEKNTLHLSQSLWIDCMIQIGADVEVCQVGFKNSDNAESETGEEWGDSEEDYEGSETE